MNTSHARSRGMTLFSLLTLATVLLAACGGAAPSPTQAPQAVTQVNNAMTIVEWSGYELEEFWQPFKDKHADVQPEWSFFAEDAEAFAKAESGFQYDLIHPCTNYWQLYVDKGLIQPIDTSRLSNWDGLRPELAKLGEFNGQQYYVPWDWGFESILVRTDKVTTMPQSWGDLWNPEYKGHVSLFVSGEANHIMTALALGFDPWNTTPEQDAQIKQKLMDLKPNLLNYWADFTEINQLIASGDVWIAGNVWNDAYKSAVDEGVPVEYLTPTEGRLGWVCGYAISAKSQNVDLAYDFLDALIAPEPMAFLSNEYAYGAANAQALPLTDPELVKLFSLDDPSILEKTVFYRPLTDAQREAFTGVWSEIKAAP